MLRHDKRGGKKEVGVHGISGFYDANTGGESPQTVFILVLDDESRIGVGLPDRLSELGLTAHFSELCFGETSAYCVSLPGARSATREKVQRIQAILTAMFHSEFHRLNVMALKIADVILRENYKMQP